MKRASRDATRPRPAPAPQMASGRPSSTGGTLALRHPESRMALTTCLPGQPADLPYYFHVLQFIHAHMTRTRTGSTVVGRPLHTFWERLRPGGHCLFVK